ncbi:MAG: hypothetical protein ACF8R7_05870 [Phycisphaerales bacterium JB039]
MARSATGEGYRTTRERSERSTLSLLAPATQIGSSPDDDGLSPRPTSPTALFTTTLNTLSQADPTTPEALTPIRAHCTRALRADTPATFNTTDHAALLRAAAASTLVAQTDIHEHGPHCSIDCAFQPAPEAHDAIEAPPPFTIRLTARNCGYATGNWRLAAIDLIRPGDGATARALTRTELDDGPEDPDDFDDEALDAHFDAELDDEHLDALHDIAAALEDAGLSPDLLTARNPRAP